MKQCHSMPRRTFVALSATAPLLFAAPAGRKIPIGLELFSVREQLEKDLKGTVRAVAKMGYEAVEFYSPYYSWTSAYAKEVRSLLDDLGINCPSTHNGRVAFTADGLKKAIELNQILGSKLIVMASAGRVDGLDGWKAVGDDLSRSAASLKPLGMRSGFHNHKTEFVPLDGKRPMDVLASSTPQEVVLQLDVGTCVEAGSDPVAWIKAHPGRIASMHCKDWKAVGEYQVLVGEGDVPWAQVTAAATEVGGIECYLIEQEGSRFSELETAQRCIANWKKLNA